MFLNCILIPRINKVNNKTENNFFPVVKQLTRNCVKKGLNFSHDLPKVIER